MHAALTAKANELRERLVGSNADPRSQHSIEQLLTAISYPFEQLRPGIVLSCSRSIEADRDAFNTEAARQELFPDAIAMMNDVLLTLQDLLAAFPIVRRIEAERLSLSIQRDPGLISTIRNEAGQVAMAAVGSEIVTDDAISALREQDEQIARARTIDVQAGLVGDKLLVVRNFVSEVVAYSRLHGSLLANSMGAGLAKMAPELKELGTLSWEAVKANLPDGLGAAAKVLPITLVAVLLAKICGPIGGLAAVVPAFKPLADLATKLVSRTASDGNRRSKR
jgi:hypothetical protein